MGTLDASAVSGDAKRVYKQAPPTLSTDFFKNHENPILTIGRL